jgi:hypothetical protein
MLPTKIFVVPSLLINHIKQLIAFPERQYWHSSLFKWKKNTELVLDLHRLSPGHIFYLAMIKITNQSLQLQIAKKKRVFVNKRTQAF